MIVTFMFHSFLFNSLARSRYLSFFSQSFSFILWSAGTAKSTILQIFFFFVDYYKFIIVTIFIIIVIIIIIAHFSHQLTLMVFHWSVSDSKSLQLSRTLLSTLADLNNAIVWIILVRPPMSNFSSPLSKPSGNIPSAPITFDITVTNMFHCFLCSLAISKFLSPFLFCLLVHSVFRLDGKVHYTTTFFY